MFARNIIYGLDMQWFLSTPPCSVNCKHFSPLESSRDVNIFLCASKFTFWLAGQCAEEPEICYSRQILKTPTWKGQTWEKGTWKGTREEKSSGASKEIKLFLNKTGEFMTFFRISDSRHVNLISCLQLPQISIRAFHNKDEKEISQVIKLLNGVYCVVDLN